MGREVLVRAPLFLFQHAHKAAPGICRTLLDVSTIYL